MHKNSIVVIGAGIVGLAVANYLWRSQPDLKITVIEKEDEPGKHQTGHNSGVIHAGIYYAPGSLKARLCKAGAEATKRFCEENDIAFDLCGKLIVASDESEIPALMKLHERSTANGLSVRLVEVDELQEMEPNVVGSKAILSPASGIVDYGLVCRVLRARLAEKGVDFQFSTRVLDIKETATDITVETDKGAYSADQVVACCGLQADRIAAMSGLADDFRIIPFRGEYFKLSERASNLVSHLIYPVPDASLPFLGVHLTKMIGGYTTVGPNAVLSLGRETYARNGMDMRDFMSSLSFPGFWKLMVRSIKPGIHELQGTLSRKVYLERCQRYCPDLTLDDLEAYPPGIRAQAVNRDGKMIEDFLLRRTARAIHVCNAPSPAATSAFPIGEEIGKQVLEQLQH